MLEAQPEPGGAVRGVHPVHVNDLCSSFSPLATVSPVLSALGLEAEGLHWSRAPRVLAHPLPDGRCALLERNVQDTARSGRLRRRRPGGLVRTVGETGGEVREQG